MARTLKATIDCAALKHNLNRVRECAKNKKIIAMVKANAYGHGLVQAALALQDADALGVACIEEAVLLREGGIKNRIILLEGFFKVDELQDLIRLQLETVVHNLNQKEILEKAQLNKHQDNPLKIWMKINTGMHRLGFQEADFLTAWQTLSQLPGVQIEGFLTHFARADEVSHTQTQTQIEQFFKWVGDLPGAKSLANSAGILAWPDSHSDWVRPGIMLYGVSPFVGRIGRDEALRPVMSLNSEVIAIQTLKAGEAVGYGGRFVCRKDTRIGVVAVGYGDGYPRVAPEGTPVLVNGKEVPLVGRVSMDMITVDLSSQPDAKVGDPVQLWGKDLPVEQVAEKIGTSAYELLTKLLPRVSVEYQNSR